MRASRRARQVRAGVAIAGIVLALGAVPAVARAQTASAREVKAAFLFNFAKFTEWPALPSGVPIAACVVGDDGVASALESMVAGQRIGGHEMSVRRAPDAAAWPTCHLLFIAETEIRRASNPLERIRTMPVLTISDGRGFAQTAGIIELFLEEGRMRFAINVNAAERSGLRLSSRLLGLAKITRDERVQ